MKLAVQWQLIQSNPAASIAAPRVDRVEMDVLDESATKEFLSFAHGRWIYPFAFLALYTGARNGELCALRWSDLDWTSGRLSIRRTAQRLPGHGLQMRPTKTHRSNRAVTLSPASLEFLTNLQAAQALVREGDSVVEDLGFILPQPSGQPYEPGQISKEFHRLNDRAGLPRGFRFHDFRHTHATLLLSAGVHPKVVSERLGHATVSITLDTYSHVLPSIQDEAAAALDRILGYADSASSGDPNSPMDAPCVHDEGEGLDMPEG